MAGPVLVIQGVESAAEVPGFERIAALARPRFAPDAARLREALPGAEVLLGFSFANRDLREAWDAADRLRWIHWCGAGVDAALFPALVESEVTVTNARGVFDRAMAEYVLGGFIAMAKDLPSTLAAQARREWNYRHTELMRGTRVVVIGAGSIGREVARLLSAFGLEVEGVSRTARAHDPDFGVVHGMDALHERLGRADWVVCVAPLTDATRDLIGAAEFAAMKPGACFANLGRGAQVDEQALLASLQHGHLGGALLDVFRSEPLPADSPLWDAPGLIVSPHMSGDFEGFREVLMAIFVDNLQRFVAGHDLCNVIDKRAGFAAG